MVLSGSEKRAKEAQMAALKLPFSLQKSQLVVVVVVQNCLCGNSESSSR
jgi:hypothetical protein